MFLQAIKDLRIKLQFACYDTATLYWHRVIFTPPYHPKAQLIEKVWTIVKNPIAYNSGPEETVFYYERKIGKFIKSVPKASLFSAWWKFALQ
jgi:transposase